MTMRPVVTSRNEQGSALFLILIAVALFGALSYAVTQSGRTGGGIEKEQAKLDTAVAEQCAGYIEHGVNKLQLHGCSANQISYELPSGANENPANTNNTSCFLFHADGAGLTACGNYKNAGDCPAAILSALAIGQVGCGTIVYAGISGGNRIYSTLADSAQSPWNNGTTSYFTTSATSTTDGLANTNTLVSLTATSDSPYQAAATCRGIGANWYLPSHSELGLFYTNKAVGALNGTFNTGYYWTSTESSNGNTNRRRFSDGDHGVTNKNSGQRIRCARR